MRTLVDTNIVLRLSEPDHAHHPKALASVEQLRDQGHQLCVVPQVLYEYWVVATRPSSDNGLGFSTRQAQADLAEICLIFSLLRDERAILERWQNLVSTLEVRGRNAHDARLVAAMQRHGLTHLLTFNETDFTRFGDINVLTPEKVLTETA